RVRRAHRDVDAATLARRRTRVARRGLLVKIHELLQKGTTFSFEFFPPRDDDMEAVLARTLRALEPLAPSYVSVTYGAGGSTRQRTHDLVCDITSATPM